MHDVTKQTSVPFNGAVVRGSTFRSCLVSSKYNIEDREETEKQIKLGLCSTVSGDTGEKD